MAKMVPTIRVKRAGCTTFGSARTMNWESTMKTFNLNKLAIVLAASAVLYTYTQALAQIGTGSDGAGTHSR